MTNNQFAMQQVQAGRQWGENQLRSLAARQSSEVKWQAQQAGEEHAPLLEGTVASASLNQDWHWHYANAVARQDAEVGFCVPPGLTFGLVYEGELQLELAGLKHKLRANQPLAFCFANNAPMQLKRRFKAMQQVHKFTLGVSRAWLNAMELEPFVQHKTQLTLFAADEVMLQAARSLVALDGSECDFQQKLNQMASVNTLLSAAAKALNEEGLTRKAPTVSRLSSNLEQRLLATLRDIIQRDNILLENIQVDDLAKTLGTSASGIQRMAKKCFGQSLLQHIRGAKLANAHRAISEQRLSIGEAAFLAGYKHPSNFALAFKRAYGVTPGEVAVIARNVSC